MREAYVALGANLGDRAGSLREARSRMRSAGIEVLRESSIYETDPVGYADQPPFLNMAVAVRTALPPLGLLRTLLGIERDMGRVREFRNGPRNIDLDLLIYEDEILTTPELTLPHPRMGERAFVLVPLKDIWTGSDFPWEAALSRLPMEGIRRWDGEREPGSEERRRSGC